MFKKKIFLTLIVILVCVFSVEATKYYISKQGRLVLDKRVKNRSKGNPKAPLWVVEYMDFQCQACKTASEILKKYMDDHPQDIYLQVRFYPLVKSHLYAFKAAIYAECAMKQDKFWPFYDTLFNKQQDWSTFEMPDALFRGYAESIGMNTTELSACLDDLLTKAAVMEEKDKAVTLGVKSTPTFFINGKIVVGGKDLEKELSDYFSPKPKDKAPQ